MEPVKIPLPRHTHIERDYTFEYCYSKDVAAMEAEVLRLRAQVGALRECRRVYSEKPPIYTDKYRDWWADAINADSKACSCGALND